MIEYTQRFEAFSATRLTTVAERLNSLEERIIGIEIYRNETENKYDVLVSLEEKI